MEVTTVSPSPTSPTEGDNLCETDVTNVAIHIVTLLVCLCGLVGNGAVLCLLSLKVRNGYIYVLAFMDILFLLFTVPSALLFLLEDVSCSPVMPQLYLSFLFQLSVVSYYWALVWLICTSSVMDVYMLCLLCILCCCDLPDCLLWLVNSVQFWAFFCLFTVSPAVTNLCPSHQQEHCQTAVISMYAVILLLFVAPMVVSITVKFIKAKWGSKKQQRERHAIIICCYTIVSSQVFLLLSCIHSSIKPSIYFLAGRFWRPCSLRCLRLSLQRVFDEQEEEAAHRNGATMDTGV